MGTLTLLSCLATSRVHAGIRCTLTILQLTHNDIDLRK